MLLGFAESASAFLEALAPFVEADHIATSSLSSIVQHFRVPVNVRILSLRRGPEEHAIKLVRAMGHHAVAHAMTLVELLFDETPGAGWLAHRLLKSIGKRFDCEGLLVELSSRIADLALWADVESDHEDAHERVVRTAEAISCMLGDSHAGIAENVALSLAEKPQSSVVSIQSAAQRALYLLGPLAKSAVGAVVALYQGADEEFEKREALRVLLRIFTENHSDEQSSVLFLLLLTATMADEHANSYENGAFDKGMHRALNSFPEGSFEPHFQQIVEFVCSDASAETRLFLLNTLGFQCPDLSRADPQFLITLTEDKEAQLRSRAVFHLEQLNLVESHSATLVACFDDADKEVRSEALMAIKGIMSFSSDAPNCRSIDSHWSDIVRLISSRCSYMRDRAFKILKMKPEKLTRNDAHFLVQLLDGTSSQGVVFYALSTIELMPLEVNRFHESILALLEPKRFDTVKYCLYKCIRLLCGTTSLPSLASKRCCVAQTAMGANLGSRFLKRWTWRDEKRADRLHMRAQSWQWPRTMKSR